MMLKPSSGIELSALNATACLTPEELLPKGHHGHHGNSASAEAEAPWRSGCGRPRPLNFWDAAARVRTIKLGILIGWRRPNDTDDKMQERRPTSGASVPGEGPVELKLSLNP